MSYQIASLFHMYIDMGERIAGKQDRFSLIIEDPLRAPKIPPKYTFFSHYHGNHIMTSLVYSRLFTIVATTSDFTVMVGNYHGNRIRHLLVPLVPLDFMYHGNHIMTSTKLNGR